MKVDFFRNECHFRSGRRRRTESDRTGARPRDHRLRRPRGATMGHHRVTHFGRLSLTLNSPSSRHVPAPAAPPRSIKKADPPEKKSALRGKGKTKIIKGKRYFTRGHQKIKFSRLFWPLITLKTWGIDSELKTESIGGVSDRFEFI